MLKLDKKDHKLLHELDINARQPVSVLAKKLKTSRDVVDYRIKRLQKEEVITGFNAFIDSSKLGYYIYRVMLKFYSISRKDYTELIEILNNNNNIFWVGETYGFVDLGIGFWFQEEEEFHEFYTKLMSRYRRYIKKDYVHRIIHNNYLDRAYILEEKQKTRLVKREEFKLGGEKKEKFDDVDLKIMKILVKDARAPIIQIAESTDLDSATIIYRIKHLEKKKIILGYRANIDLNKIKREFYTVKVYLNDFSRKKQIVSLLKSAPFVTNLIEAIGSWDVEFDMEVKNSEEYHNFIDELKDRYEEISEIEFFRASKTYKVIDAPI